MHIEVADAPAAIGPYSQAQVVRLHGGQRIVYTAGQVGIDPAKAALVSGEVAEQTAQVMKNLTAVLRGAGLSLTDVVKTTVFLVDMNDFKAMNEVYGKHFKHAPPARSTVAVSGLPLGARVEIEAIAVGREL
ncbi:MAG: Rid family detoxifying hydrolase [Candidatus Eisenbacteria bacterium]